MDKITFIAETIQKNWVFLIVLAITMVYVFYPVVNIDFGYMGVWTDFEYYTRQIIPIGTSKILFWLKFFLFEQYGSVYALLGLLELFLKTSMTGYYLVNVSLRAFAAIAIYFLANYWSGRKEIGFISGLFFAIAFPGLENTIVVIVFVSYIAVIQLVVTLYFWKRFHDNPTWTNLKLSILFFALAVFISHLRLNGLLLILLLGEAYYFITNKAQRGEYSKLRLRHIQLLTLTFVVIFFLLPAYI